MDSGNALRAARHSAHMTQRQLAAAAGTSQAAISEIERGVVTPRVDRLQRLLGLTQHELVVRRLGEPADERAPEPDELALMRRNLELTPAERLAQLTNRMRLRGLARR